MSRDTCKEAHAKLVAGKCPWCREFIHEGLTEEQWQILRDKLEQLFAQDNKRKPLREFRFLSELQRIGLPVTLRTVMKWLERREAD